MEMPPQFLTYGYPIAPLTFLRLVGLLLVAVAAHSPRDTGLGVVVVWAGASLCSIPTASPRGGNIQLAEPD